MAMVCSSMSDLDATASYIKQMQDIDRSGGLAMAPAGEDIQSVCVLLVGMGIS